MYLTFYVFIEKFIIISNSIVNAIGKAITSLGLASSLFHASQTKFGHLYDTKMVDLIIWTTYREAFQKLKTTNKTTEAHMLDLRNGTRFIFRVMIQNSYSIITLITV